MLLVLFGRSRVEWKSDGWLMEGWKREGMGVLMIETICGRMHCSLVFCSFLLIFIFLSPFTNRELSNVR